MRLTRGDVLTTQHDNTLPIVLEDAFANADPDRVQTLQRMLDLAATRGLQVIVITCPPPTTPPSARDPSSSRRFVTRILTLDSNRTGYSSLPLPSLASGPPAIVDITAVSSDLEDQFFATLAKHGGSAGNTLLRQVLGWEQATYDAVRESLVRSGKVSRGRGRGGSVQLNATAKN